MQPDYYNLLATVGYSPAVVTEAIWRLATDEHKPKLPASITILTTGPGYVAWMSKLMDSGIWRRMCEDVLDGMDIEPDVHLPTDARGIPLDGLHDINNDLILANKCYELVDILTRPGSLPLIGSLAGGHKTMSVHLLSAFTVFARREDSLIHVLAPKHRAEDPEFFYPTTESEHPEIYCVDIPFPPFGSYLKQGFFGEIPEHERDLKAIVAALRKYDFERPAKAAIFIGQGKWMASPIEFRDEQNITKGSCQLSPQNLATLLVVAQNIARNDDHVTSDDLLAERVAHQYTTIANLYRKEHNYTPWQNSQDISGAVSRLNQQLRDLPMANTYLEIKGRAHANTWIYQWNRPPSPSLELYCGPDIFKLALRAEWKTLFPSIPIFLNQAYE